MLSVDTVVFGGGVAGLATAIALRRHGQRVAVAARETARRPCLGETLSPAAKPLLAELGLWEQFLTDGHLPCHTVRSVWGGSEVALYDFLGTPHGSAWRIDRQIFERRLAEAAESLGVKPVAWRRPGAIRRAGDGWLITVPQAGPVSAGFLVDATGRAAALARRWGARRATVDRQIAVVGLLAPFGVALSDPSILIESVTDGWWYSAVLPDGNLIAALLTDPDLHPPGAVDRERHWLAGLAGSRHTGARIARYRLVSPPQIVAAGGSRLDPVAGAGWLAVGDAAMTYDPLSGHGLVVALASARDAAAAIAAHNAGDSGAITAYDAHLTREFAAYNIRRSEFYAAETRWPGSPYWRRRRQSTSPLAVRGAAGEDLAHHDGTAKI